MTNLNHLPREDRMLVRDCYRSARSWKYGDREFARARAIKCAADLAAANTRRAG